MTSEFRYNSLERIKEEAPERATGLYDARQFDYARAAGDHAACALLDGRPDWDRVDNLSEARELPPLSVVVSTLINYGIEGGTGRITSPCYDCPALGAFLSVWVRHDRVDLRTPLRHGDGRSVAPLRHGAPNHRHRNVEADCDAAVVALNGRILGRYRGDAARMLRNSWARVRPGGILLIFIAKAVSSTALPPLPVETPKAITVRGGTIYGIQKPVSAVPILASSGELLPEDELERLAAASIATYLRRGGPRRVFKVLRLITKSGGIMTTNRGFRRDLRALRAPNVHWKHRHHAAGRAARVIATALLGEFRQMRAAFLRGHYVPEPPRIFYRWKSDPWDFAVANGIGFLELMGLPDEENKNKRALAAYRVRDRLFLGIVASALTERIEPLLSPVCVGGRVGAQYSRIPRRLRDRLSQLQQGSGGYRWAKLDIRRFFDTIPVAGLARVLRRHVPRPEVKGLIAVFRQTMDDAGRGLPQGSPISAICANLFVSELVDRRLILAPGVTVERYFDDVTIDGPPGCGVSEALGQLHDLLKVAGLEIHAGKTTGVRDSGPVETLGVLVDANSITISNRTAARVQARTGDELVGSLIHYRRILPAEEFQKHFGETMDQEGLGKAFSTPSRIARVPVKPAVSHRGLSRCSPALSLSDSSKRSRLSPASGTARRTALAAVPSQGSTEVEQGYPADAVLTPWPELDARCPFRPGLVLGIHSSERRAAVHFCQELLRAHRAANPEGRIAVSCAAFDEFGDDLHDEDPVDGLILHRVRQYDRLTETGDSPPQPGVDTRLVTLEDYGLFTGLPDQVELMFVDPGRRHQPDRPGVPCTVFPTMEMGRVKPGGSAWAASWRTLREQIRSGCFREVLLGLSGHGSDGVRDPAAVLHDGLAEVLEDRRRCFEIHGFHPTVIWLTCSAGRCRRRDGSMGAGPGDGLFLQDHSDVVIGVERTTRTQPVRPVLSEDPNEIHRLYEMHVRPAAADAFRVFGAFAARVDHRKPYRGGLRSRQWDEAGRMMALLGLRSNLPEGLAGRGSLEARAALFGRDDVRRAVRSWLAGERTRTGIAWLDKRLAVPAGDVMTMRGVFTIRAAGVGPTDPARAGRIERERIGLLSARTGLVPVKASGAGAQGGDLVGSRHCVEVKCVLDAVPTRAVLVTELTNAAATAERRNRFPAFCVSFVEDDVDLVWIGYLRHRASRPNNLPDAEVIEKRSFEVGFALPAPSAFRFRDLDKWEWVLTSIESLGEMNAC